MGGRDAAPRVRREQEGTGCQVEGLQDRCERRRRVGPERLGDGDEPFVVGTEVDHGPVVGAEPAEGESRSPPTNWVGANVEKTSWRSNPSRSRARLRVTGSNAPERAPALRGHEGRLGGTRPSRVVTTRRRIRHRPLGQRTRAAEVQRPKAFADAGVGVRLQPIGQLHEVAVRVVAAPARGVDGALGTEIRRRHGASLLDRRPDGIAARGRGGGSVVRPAAARGSFALGEGVDGQAPAHGQAELLVEAGPVDVAAEADADLRLAVPLDLLGADAGEPADDHLPPTGPQPVERTLLVVDALPQPFDRCGLRADRSRAPGVVLPRDGLGEPGAKVGHDVGPGDRHLQADVLAEGAELPSRIRFQREEVVDPTAELLERLVAPFLLHHCTFPSDVTPPEGIEGDTTTTSPRPCTSGAPL